MQHSINCVKEDIKKPCCDKEKAISIVKKRIPIINWLPKYKTSYFGQDALAGITVGLTAIPQGIAYAVVAGLEPQYGLYSGLMGCIVYLFLGGCKDVNIGPTAIMSLMIQKHVEILGPDIAVLACFLTGCVICLLGLLHLGFLVDFISFPVVSGFTCAAALTIGSSQLKGLFGLPGKSNEFIASWTGVISHIQQAKLGDSLLATGSVIFLVFARYVGRYGSRKNRPGWSRSRNILGKCIWIFSLSRNALIVVAGSLIAFIFEQNGMTPFKLTGNVGVGLPPVKLPPFSTHFNNRTYEFADMTSQLGSSIIFIPLVAILESIAITKAFSKGKSVDATQELIALGFCNIFGSFIQSMSVTGSFTRTALNNSSGVRTPLGGIFTALTVLLALELLTKAFYYIPKATLSAVIVCTMVHMLEIENAILLWKTRKTEFVLFLLTLLASLALGVEYGILIGIAINLMMVLFRIARPRVIVERRSLLRGPSDEEIGYYLVTPDQGLHFPAAEYLREKIVEKCEGLHVVMDGEYIGDIDATVAKNIQTLVEDLKVRDQKVLLLNFKEHVRQCCVSLDPALDEYFVEGHLENVLNKTMTPTLEIER